MIEVFYDVETTGTNYKIHSIHQLAGFVRVNSEIKEEFDIKAAPHPNAKIDQTALDICRVTEEQIRAYQDQGAAYRQFIRLLSRYIDKYDPTNKAYLVGFNNRAFDDFFLRMLFELNNDPYIGSWFYADTLDALVLASQYLKGERRQNMPSFKLKRVAKELGIEVEKDKLHNSNYDVLLTYGIYKIVTGEEIEL